jgi:hypothetical protein
MHKIINLKVNGMYKQINTMVKINLNLNSIDNKNSPHMKKYNRHERTIFVLWHLNTNYLKEITLKSMLANI